MKETAKLRANFFLLFSSSFHNFISCFISCVFYFYFIFFLSYPPLIITPLWWGPYCITVSSCHGLFVQSAQLLHCRLSLIADIVSIDCSASCCVVLESILIPQVREPICSGYIPFHLMGEYKTRCSSSRCCCLLFSTPFCSIRIFPRKLSREFVAMAQRNFSPMCVIFGFKLSQPRIAGLLNEGCPDFLLLFFVCFQLLFLCVCVFCLSVCRCNLT